MNTRDKDIVGLQELLDKAHALGLTGIQTKIVQLPDASNGNVAVHHATVIMGEKQHTFEGTGDASPSNVGSFIKPHIIRMAETRAIVRALRWATNTGKAAREEMGHEDHTPAPQPHPQEMRQRFLAGALPLLDTLAQLNPQAAVEFGDLNDTPHTEFVPVFNKLKAAVGEPQAVHNG